MSHLPSPFDTVIDRRASHSTKWTKYDPDVLPFWVADMDFAVPDGILDALRERIDQRIIGYTQTPSTLVDAFLAWLEDSYGWQVPERWLVWLPGVVPGLNLGAAAALGRTGGVLIPTPVYYPFLDVPGNVGGTRIDCPLELRDQRWVMDFDRLEALAPQADVLLLSNPQNPTGRAYSADELRRLAALCQRHDVTLVSDEIHSAILLEPGAEHVPVGKLMPELSTISLFAPTKTYNVPGISCAVAVIPDADLRQKFLDARRGLVGSPGPLGYVAAEAAWRDRSGWLEELLSYLRRNRDLLADVAGARMTTVEATYLAWIDVQDLAATGALERHFIEHGLGLSIGSQFAGPGYVRFNFGCPRSTLEQGLERLARALQAA